MLIKIDIEYAILLIEKIFKTFVRREFSCLYIAYPYAGERDFLCLHSMRIAPPSLPQFPHQYNLGEGQPRFSKRLLLNSTSVPSIFSSV